MKIIDRNGRLFGKISIIDLVVVAVVIVMAFALYVKTNHNEITSTSTPDSTITYQMLVRGVRTYVADAVQVGDHVYDQDRNSGGGSLGVITDIDSGEPAVKPSYDYIMGFGDYGYACFERGGKFGIMDKEGNEIVPARYDGTLSTSRSLDKGYYILESGDGPFNSGIVDGRGRVIIPTDHYVQPGTDGEKLNLVMTPSGKWGFANDRGQFVIDAQFENASPFISGKNVAFVQKDGKICLVNRKGELVLKTVFSDLIGYTPDTMVCAMEYTAADGTVKGCLVKVNLPA